MIFSIGITTFFNVDNTYQHDFVKYTIVCIVKFITIIIDLPEGHWSCVNKGFFVPITTTFNVQLAQTPNKSLFIDSLILSMTYT